MGKQALVSGSAPAAIGPYSQAVRVGNTIYFSGQIPLDPLTGDLVPGDISAQTEQVMKNMGALLETAGLDFSDVVKTTIYLVDMADFGVVNTIYGSCFAAPEPARACVQVAALPKGALVEIEWIAVAS